MLESPHPAELDRNDSGWWIPNMPAPVITISVYFTVKHGGNLLRALFRASAESIAGGHAQGQSQVDPLEQLRSRFSPVIEFGKHKCMKRIVNRGSDFR